VKPLLGRLFSSDDDRRAAAPVTLISYGLWQRKFGSAPDIVGKRMNMNGRDYTVIGVMPASFHFRLTILTPRKTSISRWDSSVILYFKTEAFMTGWMRSDG
jgi:MacB-like periplasmic core domain